MTLYRIILSIICVCLTAGLTVAQEPLPTESGFSGYLEIFGAYISTNSQLNTDSGNKKTDSPDSSGERVNKFRPLPLGLLNVSAKAEWYDSKHPVFDQTRRDLNPGLFAIMGYKNPFGFKNFRIDWFNAFFKSNSNIDFYESSNFITAVGLGYRF